MKYLLFTFAISLYCLAAQAQSFEGEVIYKASYISKMPKLSSSQFTTMAGDTVKYYMKGGDYRSDSNGTLINWQIYINRDNKMYNKLTNSDVIIWDDGAINKDSILSVQLNKDATEILGYKCDELIFNCKSGVQKYYFTSQFYIDSKLYAKQVFQNWYDYLKLTNAMPLEMIIDNSEVNVTLLAASVTPMKLDDSLFILPEGAQTKQNSN